MDNVQAVGSVIVVVTAIMKEQSTMLTSKGVSAIHITSGVHESTKVALLEGHFCVIFCKS